MDTNLAPKQENEKKKKPMEEAYKNPNRKDTHNCSVVKMIIDGVEINSRKLSGDMVVKLREGSFENIKIILE